MFETAEAHYLLLVEAGAEVPGWLDLAKIECLDQGGTEPYPTFMTRGLAWVDSHPEVNTVVVSLSVSSLVPALSEHIENFGGQLVTLLHGRPKARLLLGAPANTPEKQRRRILGLTATLAQVVDGPHACVVGAHFSANPPSSSKIPLPASSGRTATR